MSKGHESSYSDTFEQRCRDLALEKLKLLPDMPEGILRKELEREIGHLLTASRLDARLLQSDHTSVDAVIKNKI